VRNTGIAILTLVILIFFLTDILSWGFGSPEFWYRPYLIWAIAIIVSATLHKLFYYPDDN